MAAGYNATKNKPFLGAAVNDTTDNTGGAVSDTAAAVSDTPTKNALASLISKQNQILAVLRAAGIIDS